MISQLPAPRAEYLHVGSECMSLLTFASTLELALHWPVQESEKDNKCDEFMMHEQPAKKMIFQIAPLTTSPPLPPLDLAVAGGDSRGLRPGERGCRRTKRCGVWS